MKKLLQSPLIKGPLWTLELFTGAKSFQDNPIIGNTLLNKLGLHIIRICISHAVMNMRMWALGIRVAKEDRKSYQRRGFIMKENYLSASDFKAMEQEVRNWQGKARTFNQGDTETKRTLLSPDTLEHLPHTAKILAGRDFQRLLKYTNAHQRLPFFNIERITNGARANQATDPQKNLHSDTFHPTMKFWLYLDDVDEHNGPFTYRPGSNRLSLKRLAWEYKASQVAHKHPNRLAARGSFRFSEKDCAEIGLKPPRAFTVKKNTLLIANTFGIHGRGQADTGSTRLALWGMGRTNPFIPFPGTGLNIVNHYQYKVLEWLKQWK
uniref:Phytanoyl-CoA dioxygenase n=1 Tax=uncultured Thiotrichaceae bacterium TaxID=298394 RepID=A0A6S6T8U9_9GAMM|nr:MAG: Phytanoyl-CoA dioxygenase [uncultured Thiotrichaceae bacterium]